MTACTQCPHFESEHDEPALGGRCRVRHYHPFLQGWTTSYTYDRCECPGWDPADG